MKTKEEIQDFFLEEYRKNRFGTDGSFMQGQIYNMHLGEGEYDILAKQVLPELVEKGMFTLNNGTYAITEKGHGFIYNGSNKPKSDYIKVIPENMDVSSNEAFNTMWEWIGEKNAPMYLTAPQLYKMMLKVDKTIPPSYGIYMDELREKGKSTEREAWVRDFWRKLSKEQKESFFELVEEKVNNMLSEQEVSHRNVNEEEYYNKVETQQTINQYVNAVNVNMGNGSITTRNVEATLNQSIDSVAKENLMKIIAEIEEEASKLNNDELNETIVDIKEEMGKLDCRPKFLRKALYAIRGIAEGIVANELTPLVSQALDLLG